MRFGVLAVEVIADEAIAARHCGHGSRGNELIEHVGQALVRLNVQRRVAVAPCKPEGCGNLHGIGRAVTVDEAQHVRGRKLFAAVIDGLYVAERELLDAVAHNVVCGVAAQQHLLATVAYKVGWEGAYLIVAAEGLALVVKGLYHTATVDGAELLGFEAHDGRHIHKRIDVVCEHGIDGSSLLQMAQVVARRAGLHLARVTCLVDTRGKIGQILRYRRGTLGRKETEAMLADRHSVYGRGLEPMLMHLAVGEGYVAAYGETAVVVAFDVLYHATHNVIEFKTLAIMIGQRTPNWHTTPAPGAHGVGKNSNLHIAHNILFWCIKETTDGGECSMRKKNGGEYRHTVQLTILSFV